jgi:hypothetical protein
MLYGEFCGWLQIARDTAKEDTKENERQTNPQGHGIRVSPEHRAWLERTRQERDKSL